MYPIQSTDRSATAPVTMDLSFWGAQPSDRSATAQLPEPYTHDFFVWTKDWKACQCTALLANGEPSRCPCKEYRGNPNQIGCYQEVSSSFKHFRKCRQCLKFHQGVPEHERPTNYFDVGQYPPNDHGVPPQWRADLRHVLRERSAAEYNAWHAAAPCPAYVHYGNNSRTSTPSCSESNWPTRIQTPEARIHTPETRIQTPEAGNQTPETRTSIEPNVALQKQIADQMIVDKIVGKIDTLGDKVATVIEKVDTVMKQHVMVIEKIDGLEIGLGRRIDTVLHVNGTLGEQVVTVMDKVHTVMEQHKMVIAKIEHLEIGLGRLELDCEHRSDQCNDLVGKVMGRVDKLIDQVGLVEQNDDSKRMLIVLTREIETLQDHKETLTDKIKTLQEHEDTLRERKETLADEIEMLQREKEKEQNEKETLAGEIEMLQEQKENKQNESGQNGPNEQDETLNSSSGGDTWSEAVVVHDSTDAYHEPCGMTAEA